MWQNYFYGIVFSLLFLSLKLLYFLIHINLMFAFLCAFLLFRKVFQHTNLIASTLQMHSLRSLSSIHILFEQGFEVYLSHSFLFKLKQKVHGFWVHIFVFEKTWSVLQPLPVIYRLGPMSFYSNSCRLGPLSFSEVIAAAFFAVRWRRFVYLTSI